MLAWFIAAAALGQASPPQGTPARLRSGYISDADYPSSARRANEQGTVRMRIGVSARGDVAGCDIEISSGSAALDQKSCQIVRERYHFDPARNAAGRPVPATYTQSINWILPNDNARIPVAPLRVARSARMTNGLAQSCTIQRLSQTGERPAQTCQSIFAGIPGLARVRSNLTSATHVYSFIPAGTMSPVADPSWGRLLYRAEAMLVIGPDGRVTGCTPVPGPRPADLELGYGNACRLGVSAGTYEGAPGVVERRVTVQIDLYGVRRSGQP